MLLPPVPPPVAVPPVEDPPLGLPPPEVPSVHVPPAGTPPLEEPPLVVPPELVPPKVVPAAPPCPIPPVEGAAPSPLEPPEAWNVPAVALVAAAPSPEGLESSLPQAATMQVSRAIGSRWLRMWLPRVGLQLPRPHCARGRPLARVSVLSVGQGRSAVKDGAGIGRCLYQRPSATVLSFLATLGGARV